MSTATLNDTNVLIRNRMLNYSYSGQTIQTLGLGTRMYQESPPDGAAFPYGYFSLVSRFGGIRSTPSIEVMLFDRPRSQLARLRNIEEHIDGALTDFVFAASNQGLLWVQEHDWSPVPNSGSDVDREVIQHRGLYSTILWSQAVAKHYP